ncbi:nucleoside transporter family protein [Thermoanaerobacterium thermosaccharolyticum]|uniref:Nucleoside transporter family protein n=1 Tax=Thermoanaerobacterium thermosaccharolyticum TaxID=1517 RepID=A0A223HX52_THETR|nr:hypothetical protein [Thermoanaerobacterium thermosaccharolyticum]AST56855.1 nucleoside transporter family protein [Thermoanaerobacterium thermosaccharolyticum]
MDIVLNYWNIILGIFLLMLVLAGFSYSYASNKILNAFKPGIYQTSYKTSGTLALTLYTFDVIVLIVVIVDINSIYEFLYFLFTGILFIFSSNRFNKISDSILFKKEYIDLKKSNDIFVKYSSAFSVAIIIVISGFLSIYFSLISICGTPEIDKFRLSSRINFTFIVVIAFIKFLVYLFYNLISVGYIQTIASLKNSKKVVITGDKIRKINQIINDNYENTLMAYLIAETKKEYILRPMNYRSIKINKDDIDIMLIVPD